MDTGRFKMTVRDILRNKMVLGALTMEDLCKVSLLRGEFTFGKHWISITETKRKNRSIVFFMGDADPEFSVPLERLVRVSGNTVWIETEWGEVTLRLEDDPFPFPGNNQA